MARDPYNSVSVSGYNSSPPPDDGSQTSGNLITWSKIKTELTDPLNTAFASIDTEVLNRFEGTPYAVSTIAALTALTKEAIASDLVFVEARSSAGDGGGGFFYWEAAATDTEDSGTIFEADSGGTGRWKRIYSGAVNLAWFGDLTTDIGAAFNSAVGGGHTELEVPAGSWTQATAFDTDSNDIMIFSGPLDNPLNTISATITKDSDFAHYSGTDSFNSWGIEYSGNGVAGSSDGIVLRKKSVFYGAVKDQPGIGLRLEVTTGTHNLNNTRICGTFSSNGSHGVYIDDTTVSGSGNIDVNLINSPWLMANSNGGDGVHIKSGLHLYLPHVQADNNTGYGVRFQTNNEINNGIFGVYAESNTAGDLDITDSSALFTDNIFIRARGNWSGIKPQQRNMILRGARMELDAASNHTGPIVRNSSANDTSESVGTIYEIAGSAQGYCRLRGDGRLQLRGQGNGKGVDVSDGVWNQDPMLIGTNHFWTNSNTLRMTRSGAPTSATDGEAIVTTQTGTSAPGSTPDQVGQMFVDTSGNTVYVATGTASSADWTAVN